MPNTNCLEGWKCPECAHVDSFRIDVVIYCTVILTDNGTDNEENIETTWKGDSPAACNECGFSGVVSDFTKED